MNHMHHPNFIPLPPPPPPPIPGIPQAHVHHQYYPPPPALGAQWLPPPPPPPGRPGFRAWKGEVCEGTPRPAGNSLTATESICNALLKSQQPCRQQVAHHSDGYLPVCKRHKKVQVLAGHCQQNRPGHRCNKLIKYTLPFAQLCDDHRDWDGLPCYLLKLPVELRMQIFSYLFPDKPINAWLDAPLRIDRQRCTWELLLVNKQISAEASDVLYGSQPFTVSLGRDNLVMCGGIYSHDKSDWPSIMVFSPPRPDRVGHPPPMLSRIRHLRLQIAFVNPGFPAGRPQHYPTWEESIDLYDLRDSARALVHLLRKAHSLQSLRVVLIAQNTTQSWSPDEHCRILQTITEPLAQLRNIPRVDLIGNLQIHFSHRLSYTQYFPENMRPATTDDVVAQPGEFILSYKYSGQKAPTSMKVTSPLAQHAGFATMKSQVETLIRSNEPVPEPPADALDAFCAFRKAYHAVEAQFRTVLPRGKNWLLHKARMCRERGDVAGIAVVRKELETEVRRLVTTERENIDLKEKAALEALRGFDEERSPAVLLEKDVASEEGEGREQPVG